MLWKCVETSLSWIACEDLNSLFLSFAAANKLFALTRMIPPPTKAKTDSLWILSHFLCSKKYWILLKQFEHFLQHFIVNKGMPTSVYSKFFRTEFPANVCQVYKPFERFPNNINISDIFGFKISSTFAHHMDSWH